MKARAYNLVESLQQILLHPPLDSATHTCPPGQLIDEVNLCKSIRRQVVRLETERERGEISNGK